MITPAQRAEIRRLYYGEHWKLGTIAAQLGLHRETVRAAVERGAGSVRRGVCRPSALDPYLPFIRDTPAQYPTLRATRIHEMVRQRGYPGSVIQVRRLVRRLTDGRHPALPGQAHAPPSCSRYSWGGSGSATVSPPTGSDCRALVTNADRRLTVRPTSAGEATCPRRAHPGAPDRANGFPGGADSLEGWSSGNQVRQQGHAPSVDHRGVFAGSTTSKLPLQISPSPAYWPVRIVAMG